MSRENVEVVRQVVEASAGGVSDARVSEALALLDPHVEWDASRTAPGLGDFAEVRRGREEVREFLGRWSEAWEHDQLDSEELIDAGDVVISIGTQHARGRASGLSIERPMAGVWTLRAGKIVRVVWYPSRGEALEAVDSLP